MTPTPPYPITYSRRRSKRKMIEQMRQINEQHETMMLDRQFKMQELMQKLEVSKLPPEILDMMKMQIETLVPISMEIPSLEKMKAEEMEQLADRAAGIYIERDGDNFKTWNFAGLLGSEDVTCVEFDANLARAIIYAGARVIERLDGPAAIYFIRYLHYTGIFELEAAKKACPDCSGKPPQDCETCGGLGWVL